jgi:pimeloyl-ACP methyl ester carboxylesterase
VILVDYPGVGSSTGEPSSTIAETALHMIALVGALGFQRIDLLGFSIGGFVAQEIALVRPAPIRRLVLVATGPKGAPGMHGWRKDIAAAARGESKPENLLYIMLAHTDTSQAKGMEFLDRFLERRHGRDTPTSDAARDAQYDAIVEWGIPDHGALQRLTGIQSPTLVLQGDNDLMIPTKLSHLLTGLIPDAQIRTHPDAEHGFRFQYPTEVAAEVNEFLGPTTRTCRARPSLDDMAMMTCSQTRWPGGRRDAGRTRRRRSPHQHAQPEHRTRRAVRGDRGAADEPPRTRTGPRPRLAHPAR